MSADFLSLDPVESARGIGRVVLSAVVPRPIGWISTVAADGTPNLAPFSYFNLISSSPPAIMVSPAARGDRPKDTLANARATGELVAHIVDAAHARAMNETAAEVGPEVDEFALGGLITLPSDLVRPPRIATAPVAMEARTIQFVEIPDSPYTVILARVVRIHVRRDVLDETGAVDPRKLRPVARLGGELYAELGEIFAMKRPP
ncbi:MAG: flavin reductase family protein [Chloroflexi bacterium]|nr:flavin reductase family protein [Chloroflexota bacterium]